MVIPGSVDEAATITVSSTMMVWSEQKQPSWPAVAEQGEQVLYFEEACLKNKEWHRYIFTTLYLH